MGSPPPSAQIPYTCTLTSLSDTSITCTLPPGVGHNYYVMVQNYVLMSIPQIQIGVSSSTNLFGYIPPALSSLSYTSANTAGGDLLTITGTK